VDPDGRDWFWHWVCTGEQVLRHRDGRAIEDPEEVRLRFERVLGVPRNDPQLGGTRGTSRTDHDSIRYGLQTKALRRWILSAGKSMARTIDARLRGVVPEETLEDLYSMASAFGQVMREQVGRMTLAARSALQSTLSSGHPLPHGVPKANLPDTAIAVFSRRVLAVGRSMARTADARLRVVFSEDNLKDLHSRAAAFGQAMREQLGRMTTLAARSALQSTLSSGHASRQTILRTITWSLATVGIVQWVVGGLNILLWLFR
jgi:hypothetical protein